MRAAGKSRRKDQIPTTDMVIQRILKPLLIIVGILSAALGILGMFLPLLPTTPFLLLAAFCFSRSSERLHRRLLENRWFGRYLRDYYAGRGVPRRAKVAALVMLWLSVGYAVGFVIPILWVKALLLAIAAAVTVHIARLKPAAPAPPATPASAAGASGPRARHG